MELLRLLENIRFPFLDSLIGIVTRLGEETVAVVVICVILWFVNKRVAYMIGVAFFLSGITVQGAKICFRVDRPWIIDTSLNPVPSATSHATGYSFPSGHTQAAASLFGSLGVAIRRRPIKTACILIPFLVAFSRMYLGVHTLLDVTVSLGISFAFILLTQKLLRDDSVNKKRDIILSVFMLLYTVAVIVIAAILFASGRIEERYLSDCLKASGAGIGFSVGMFIERNYIKFSVAAKSKFMQATKFAFGFLGVIVIQEGIKLIAGTGLIIDAFRYFLMIMWAIVFFPIIIKRFFAVP